MNWLTTDAPAEKLVHRRGVHSGGCTKKSDRRPATIYRVGCNQVKAARRTRGSLSGRLAMASYGTGFAGPGPPESEAEALIFFGSFTPYKQLRKINIETSSILLQ